MSGNKNTGPASNYSSAYEKSVQKKDFRRPEINEARKSPVINARNPRVNSNLAYSKPNPESYMEKYSGDMYDDIPPEVLEENFELNTKNYRAPDYEAFGNRDLVARPSGGLADTEEEMVRSVIEESKKGILGLTEDEILLNQIILESYKINEFFISKYIMCISFCG